MKEFDSGYNCDVYQYQVVKPKHDISRKTQRINIDFYHRINYAKKIERYAQQCCKKKVLL